MTYPVSTAEFMEHVRYTADASELSQAEMMLGSATAFAEQYTGRRFMTTTLVSNFDKFPTNTRKAPLAVLGGSVSSILSITYYDTDYVQQTLAPSLYRLINKNDRGFIYSAMGEEWPTNVATGEPDVITLTYSVGGSADSVPASVRSAILLIAASLWENRENEIIGSNIKSLKPSTAAKDLLHPYKLR